MFSFNGMNMSQRVVLENTEYRQKCGWGSKDSWGRGRPACRGENWLVVSIDDDDVIIDDVDVDANGDSDEADDEEGQQGGWRDQTNSQSVGLVNIPSTE